MYLAANARETPPITILEVAEQFKIPNNHLVKVTGRLAKQGLVLATRGRAGGLKLAVLPHQIKLGEALTVLEGHNELINCEQLACNLAGGCALKYVLDKSLESFYESLNQYTLADVIKGNIGKKISAMQTEYVAIHQKVKETIA